MSLSSLSPEPTMYRAPTMTAAPPSLPAMSWPTTASRPLRHPENAGPWGRAPYSPCPAPSAPRLSSLTFNDFQSSPHSEDCRAVALAKAGLSFALPKTAAPQQAKADLSLALDRSLVHNTGNGAGNSAVARQARRNPRIFEKGWADPAHPPPIFPSAWRYLPVPIRLIKAETIA